MGCTSSLRRHRHVGNNDEGERGFSILGVTRTASRSGGGNSPLHLPTTKLTFTRDQLVCLNHYFNEQLDNRDNDVELARDTRDELHSLVERLIQRLICAVGTLDPRFASMLLINADPSTSYTTHRPTNTGSLRLSYLVRLDPLSSPSTFDDDEEEEEEDEAEEEEEGRRGRGGGGGGGRAVCVVCEGEGGPQGFAKIRLQGDGCHRWAEFVNSNGYLRRDKMQERFVELLAQAVARGGKGPCGTPAQIDETRLAGAPGKVMPDALTAHRVLRTPAAQRIYYGPASTNRTHFPDPRDFRIAIVDGGGPCVRLRVALLNNHNQLFSARADQLFNGSADRDVSVTLTLGIEAEGWPRSADFPLPRTAITHCDALLYQRAATTGFYLVPCSPHPSTRCDDRCSTWQLRFPAAECLLLLADSKSSTANRTLATLSAILCELRRTTVSGGRACSHHLMATLVWFALENEAGSPMQAMRKWHRSQLSRHVLKCLDQLIAALQTQRQRSYFFPWLNVVLNSADCDTGHNTTHHFTEEDFIHDAQLLHTYLTRLHAVSLSPRLATYDPCSSDSSHHNQVTSELTARWSRLLDDMAPRARGRQRGGGWSEAAYSPRQLAYVGQLFRGMLTVKTLTLMQTQNMPSWYDQDASCNNPPTPTSFYQADQPPSQGSEDVVYLLSAILDQARSTTTTDKKSSTLKSRKSPVSTNRRGPAPYGSATNTMDAYQSAVYCLMQQVRDDRCQLPYNDDVILVREVLRWLYLAADLDRKQLSAVVRPFLQQLFLVSHQNCWQLTSTDLWLRNMDSQEAHALGRFCALVNCAGLRPRDGVVDALRKGWNWAASLVEAASRMQDGVELILTPRDGTTIRHRVTVINYNNRADLSTTRSLGRGVDSSSHLATTVTLPRVSRQQSLTLHESLAARFSQPGGVAGVGEGVGGVDQWQTPHSYLRANSPMTLVAMATAKQFTNQRSSYATTIVNALITLNKFTVLQEIASLLPEDERCQTLDDIRRIIRERRRTHAHNRATVTAHAHNNNSSNSFSSQHSGKASTGAASDRSLVGIDSVPIINNNNHHQHHHHSQQRTQSCLNMTTMDDNYATYRSFNELSFTAAAAADDNLKSADRRELSSKSADNQLIDEPPSADTLLGTCRMARSRQNLSTVCDAAFFDAPIFFADSTKFNPIQYQQQPLLALTADNRLTLLRKSQQCQSRCDVSLNEKSPTTKKEMVTKL